MHVAICRTCRNDNNGTIRTVGDDRESVINFVREHQSKGHRVEHFPLGEGTCDG